MSAPLRTRGVFIHPDDVYAFCKTDYPNNYRHDYLGYPPRESTGGNSSVELYTRLRESGRNDPLLRFTLSGRDAIDVWEAATRLAEPGGDFTRCGRWVLRPRRVRLLRYAENGASCGGSDATYTAYFGMTDDTAGGWVSKVQLDLESGRALEGLLAREDVKVVGG